MNIGSGHAAFAATVLFFWSAAALAELPVEHATVAELKPDNGHRLYIADKTPPAHAVDSKIRIIDGDDFSILGQLTNGSFGSFAISASTASRERAMMWSPRSSSESMPNSSIISTRRRAPTSLQAASE